jgi:hypothetical protein
MVKLIFSGSQDTNSGEVKVVGYMRVLLKGTGFLKPVSGLMTIHDKDNLNYIFKGSIIKVGRDIPPIIELYTTSNLRQELFYRLQNQRMDSNKLGYSGIWCPFIEETRAELLAHPFSAPKNAKRVSLEFTLRDGDKSLLERSGICK